MRAGSRFEHIFIINKGACKDRLPNGMEYYKSIGSILNFNNMAVDGDPISVIETVTTEDTEFTSIPIYKIKELMADNPRFKE